MFGFLKDKLNNFGQKLKETISGKEKEQQKTEETKKEAEKPKEEKQPNKKEEKKEQKHPKKSGKEELIIEERPEEKTDELEKKLFKEIEEEIKKEDLKKAQKEEKTKTKMKEETATKKETIVEEKKQIVEEKKKPEKKGLLEKLFGKKKEEPKEEPKKPEKKETETIAKLKQEKTEKEMKEEIHEVEKAIKEEALEPKITEEEKKVDEIEEELKESGEENKEERIAEQEKRMEEKRQELLEKEIKGAEEDKRELKAKIGITSGVKAFIFGGVEIKEKELEELLWELEMSLLESDVEQDAAHELVSQIKKRLVGQKVSAKNIDEYLKEQIKEILKEMMHTEKIDLLKEIKNKKEKPYRILLLGPNGAGKTTSIAKLTKLLEKNKMTAVWAAADTFRAAAIDQLEEHATKLKVRMIKQQYGADPAAVAFDAIKAAEAGKNDVVIIDSAGRQETNKNLMEELRKIERVAKPDLKLYVGESYAGQGLLEQAKEFDEITKLDGFILTKIDTDAKGGTAISLLYKIKKPILFVGTGQGYEDFQEFTEDFIINRII